MKLPTEFDAWLSSSDGELLREDVKAWAQWKRISAQPTEAFKVLAGRGLPEFKSLVDYRLSKSRFGKEFFRYIRGPRANDLYISCEEIGPRFIIQHGHSTWILAERIGADFWVNQNVTIGFARGGRPSIGDKVSIRPSAVVTGPISIGKNSIVGPCAFVNFDVPDDTIVLPPRAIMHPRKSRRL